MNRYKTVLFDLDGTLVLSEPDPWELYVRLAREYGLSVSESAARSAERFAHRYFAGFTYKADYDRLGQSAFREHYMRLVLAEMGCAGDLDAAAHNILQRFRETPRTRYIPTGTRETLATLRTRGYTLGLVTNRRSDEMAEAYAPHSLEDFFSFVITSSDAANPKPDRAMFDLALARGGCECAETMHVGDNYYADVAGAHACGIEPVLFDPKRLFPEAECLVIRALPELLNHLK
ncbi:MAG: HAD family hydrolase [Chloroflexi bacterium]|nr:HAD family hydrolase [Chloroflexota bacterium]